MPSEHPAPPTDHVDTLLRSFTGSARGPTVLRVNDTRVLLRPGDNGATLVMQAHLCDLPRHSGPRAALCEALLVANTQLADRDRLGVELAGNAAVYQRVVDAGIDAGSLGHEVWELIDAAEQLRLGLGRD